MLRFFASKSIKNHFKIQGSGDLHLSAGTSQSGPRSHSEINIRSQAPQQSHFKYFGQCFSYIEALMGSWNRMRWIVAVARTRSGSLNRPLCGVPSEIKAPNALRYSYIRRLITECIHEVRSRSCKPCSMSLDVRTLWEVLTMLPTAFDN